METRQKVNGQLPVCQLQVKVIYHFPSYFCPFIPPYTYTQTSPFQLHIIFQAKYESIGAPAHTSVPLPRICYSCFCDVTDWLIEDGGLLTP